MDADELIKYFKSLGLEVHTTTKARGHQGFFMKNRIDISKNLPDNKVIPALLHEFAHYIHSKLEHDINKTGGSLEVLFLSKNPVIKSELINVTRFADENSKCTKLYEYKDRIKKYIKEYETIIKQYYPDFLRSKKFKEFDKYIKKSKAKYLLKHDRVKLISGFFGSHEEIFTLDNIEKDFPTMPKAFCSYLRLRSMMRKQARITSRINKYKKYYAKPAELFARFVEGMYKDREQTRTLAPVTSKIFDMLLDKKYYFELDYVLKNIDTVRQV